MLDFWLLCSFDCMCSISNKYKYLSIRPYLWFVINNLVEALQRYVLLLFNGGDIKLIFKMILYFCHSFSRLIWSLEALLRKLL